MYNARAIVDPSQVCFKCLKIFNDKSLHKIKIPAMGYGSGFDGWSTKIHLCDDCIEGTQEWWKLKEINEYDFHESYQYEDEIFAFVNKLPIEGMELFWNRYSTDSYTMDSQDWIDYELGLLSHEKCRTYGRYSPQEENAYQQRFPICKDVKINLYSDGSKGACCPWGAFGNSDGTAKGHQTQSQCYDCTYFKIRENEIMTIDLKQEEIKRIKQQIINLEVKLAELEN